jgi:hypothetical protein
MPDRLAARHLFHAMRRDHDDPFRFSTHRDPPCTDNVCKRAQRPAVIFRKATGVFRAE